MSINFDNIQLWENIQYCMNLFVSSNHDMELSVMAMILLDHVLSLSQGKRGYIMCIELLDDKKLKCISLKGFNVLPSTYKHILFDITRFIDPSENAFTNTLIKNKITTCIHPSQLFGFSTTSNDMIVLPLYFKSKLNGIIGFENGFENESNEDLIKWLYPLSSTLVSNVLGYYLTYQSVSTSQDLFLSAISHEIRTPLNGIVGMSRILKESVPLTDEQKSYIAVVSDCTNQLLELVNDILDFSKIGCEQIKFNYCPFDMRQCIEEIYDLVYLKIQNKKLNLWSEYKDHFPFYLLGDKQRIKQIIVNLVNNAIKFTESGSITIRIYFEKLDEKTFRELQKDSYIIHTDSKAENNKIESEQYDNIQEHKDKDNTSSFSLSPAEYYNIHFEIEDTGIGIAPENKDTLFKSFSQVKTQKPNHEGVGLGLVISRRLCELMGGKIKIKNSIINKGTCMHFNIPLQKAPDFFQQQKEKEILMTSIKDKTVLLIDFYLNRRVKLIDELVKLQIKPYSCSTVEEALTYIKHFSIDCLVVENKSTVDSLLQEINHLHLPIIWLEVNTENNNNDVNIFSNNLSNNNISVLTSPRQNQSKSSIQSPRSVTSSILTSIQSPRSVTSSDQPLPSFFFLQSTLPKTILKNQNIFSDTCSQHLSGIVINILKEKNSDKTISSLMDILIVEDNTYNMFVIKETLKKIGYDEKNIHEAKTGSEAIQKAVTKFYDVILMDLLLPSVDGITAGTQIINYYKSKCPKNLKPFLYDSLIPTIIALTAMVTTETQNKCKQAGFKGFLSKPLDKEELDTMLTIVAKRRHQIINLLLSLEGDQRINVHANCEEAFIWACEYNQLEVVKLLLSLEGDRRVDVRVKYDLAFRTACANNNIKVVKLLLSLEGDRRVNIHMNNDIIFIDACCNGFLEIVKLLLSLEGDRRIDVHSMYDMAFWRACYNKRLGVVKLLLSLEEDRKINVYDKKIKN